ncbi:MAG: hypothetical protein ABJC19_04845 [Gemmatimonadota bacterium]
MRHRLGLLFLLAAAPAAGQGPIQRHQLTGWLDSLHRASTPTEVEALAPAAGVADGAVRQLRRALLNTRRGEVEHDRRAFERALFDFDQSSARHKSWAWPELGMALTFAALHRGDYIAVGSDGQYQSESHAEAVWRHLQEGVKRDPTSPDIRAFAIRVLVAGGDRELTTTQARLLTGLLAVPAPEPDAWLVFGRWLRGRTRYDSALQAFDRSLVAGGDASRLALERARTMMPLGDSLAAAASYWKGLQHPTVIGRSAYRTDLAWILGPDSLSAFDAATGDSLLPFLTRFWARRDMRSAKTTDGRLLEHLRRWAIAFANFKVVDPWRRTMFTRIEFAFEGFTECVASNARFYQTLARTPPVDAEDIRGREQLLDHRGLIYLRHGTPIGRIARTVVSGPTPITEVGIATKPLDFNYSPSQEEEHAEHVSRQATAAWMYWIDGDWRILFFRGSKALGTEAPTTLTSYLPLNFGAEWYAIGQMAPQYAAAASKLETYRGMQPKSCLGTVKQAIATSRRDATTGIATESDSPPITRPWDAALNVFVLGTARDASGRALVTFALPTDRLIATPRDDGRHRFEIRFRISAYEAVTGKTMQIDTVRRFTSDVAPAPRQFLTGLFEIPLGPGRWELTLLARQQSDSTGAFGELRGREVSRGDRLAMSDLITGIPNGTPLWQSAAGAFPLNALGSWSRKTPLELYFEIYGLPVDADYRTSIEVRLADQKKGKSILISETGRARGATTLFRRSLDLGQLSPGSYLVVVRVTHGSDSVVSERPLLIRAK